MGKREVVRTFYNKSSIVKYFLNLLAKGSLTLAIAIFPLSYIFSMRNGVEQTRFVFMYIIALVLWGFILLRMIIYGLKSLPKGKFDVLFLLFITLVVLSNLLSANQEAGLWGVEPNWAYSILTSISLFIIYYFVITFLSYRDGVKWIFLGFILAIVLSSLLNLYYLLAFNWVGDASYFQFAMLSIPMFFVFFTNFKKLIYKVGMFFILLSQLILVSYRPDRLAFWGLLFGALVVLVIIYLYIWVKYFNKITASITSLKYVFKNKLKSVHLEIFGMVLAVGLVVAILAFYLLVNFKDLFYDNFTAIWKNSLNSIDGARYWLIGNNDLKEEQPQIFLASLLKNFGLLGLFSFAMLVFSMILLEIRSLIRSFQKSNIDMIFFNIAFIIVTVAFSSIASVGIVYSIILFFFALLLGAAGMINYLNREDKTFENSVVLENLPSKSTRLKKVIKVVLCFVLVVVVGFGISMIVSKKEYI